ncbi:hypothetical protein GH714_037728 [Hevea brasiliensis]|uniref:Uncharacterized protein n=1 Tax=Hevea brasiliensis TaxID=3981 RepID=A0A6A6KC60_HEVBR|nr:hypothetical protein GH714_037728 [Hevea brasiliensis]
MQIASIISKAEAAPVVIIGHAQEAEKVISSMPFEASASMCQPWYLVAIQWDVITNARRTMQRNNVKKDPDFSWMDVKNRVRLFAVEDRFHSEADSTYDKAVDMMERIKGKRYVTDFVLLYQREIVLR